MPTAGITEYDVVVIGGGPAGMMAAARAGERGRSVLLLEKNARLGKKLSITGGGRCNVTNNKPDVRTMLAQYSDAGKFLFSPFSQHAVTDTIDWFATRRVTVHEENEGRLFPETNSAETICAVLAAELKAQNVMVRLRSAVGAIERGEGEQIRITLEGGEVIVTKRCIVATGGVSRPETGSTGEGFTWLKQLGHTIHESPLALVPLTAGEEWVADVSGVTLPDVKLTVLADGQKQLTKRGKLLFTHTGVSGPTILNMSSKVGELLDYSDVRLLIDLFPELDEGALRDLINEQLAAASNKKLVNVLAVQLPKALGRVILAELKIDGETPCHSVRATDRSRLVQHLKRVPLQVTGLLGADKAVISRGGVSLTEIDFKTMHSKVVPGISLVGDVLDIDRPSGGYSLQLCWTTGYVAGSHV